MNYKRFKRVAKWISLIASVISLGLILFVRWIDIFESANTAGLLVFSALIGSIVAIVFGLVALPRWQGLLALMIAFYVGYCVMVGSLYGIQ